MPRYNGVNHLAMATGDIEGTIRFWRDLLGMPLVIGLGRTGYRHYFFEISAHDMIAFFEWSRVEPLEMKDHGFPVQGPFAFDHVSIGVADEEALWEVKARLDAAGFEPSEVVDHGFIHSVYAFDPNNIPIEFSWNVPGTDPRDRPALVDLDPVPAVLEGTRPQPGHWPESTVETKDERQVFAGEGRDVLDPTRNHW